MNHMTHSLVDASSHPIAAGDTAKRARRTPHQSGFSLIEVMITIVIVAIGLLGFAGLQAYSLKSNRTAMYRSLATIWAYDILDRIRANQAGKAAYIIGDIPDCTQPVDTTTITYIIPTNVTTDGTFAQNDRVAWVTNGMNTALPGAEVAVDINGNDACVSIQWTENVDSERTVSFTTSTAL